MRYGGYGIEIESDAPLSGLPTLTAQGPAGLSLTLLSCPEWASAFRAPVLPIDRRRISPIGGGGFFRITYPDATEFVLSDSGDRVWGTWHPPLTLEDTFTYALGPILAFALRRMGRVCLHASAVAMQGRAVLFLGQPGAGKSTTAAMLHQRGHDVLTDDISALRNVDGRLHVDRGHAWLRLWPRSVELLLPAGEDLPRLTPNWEKRYLDSSAVADSTPRAASMPVGQIYFLGGFEPDTEGGPVIRDVSQREALLLLVTNTQGHALVPEQNKAGEFEMLGRIAREIRCGVITGCRKDVPMEDLVTAIEHDVTRGRIAERPLAS